MDLRFIIDTLKAIRLELYRYRKAATLVFMLSTSAILAVAYFIPKTYTSEALLYADSANILEPLLRGSAEVTSIDRVNEAREVFQSRSLLTKVAMDAGLLTGMETDQEKNGIVSKLRNSIKLQVSGRSYLEVSYSSKSADQSFEVVSAILNRFMEKTSRDKRSESRGAFEFINSQVQTYKRQLEEAEAALKEFKSNNMDGSESSVQARIEELRSQIEDLKLQIQASESQVELTREQLSSESPYREVVVSEGRSSIDTRLANMQQKLDSLQLVYHDSHPDVVEVLDQIESLKKKKQEAQEAGADEEKEGVVTEVIENPVHEKLQIKLSENETNLEVQRNRLAAVRELLQEEYKRAERVAENQAELKELTRDYNVTKGVYEDMLQRREKARLSMTLDVEGEGASYQIQEPASYPTHWNGLQLAQIAIAAPILGVFTVIGLLAALVLFDNRVRSSRTLTAQLPAEVPVLASIPHYNSSWKDRMLRADVLAIVLVLILFTGSYVGILLYSVLGIQPQNWVDMLASRLQG